MTGAPEFANAEVPDEVWAALLRLKHDAQVEADPGWSPAARAAWSLYAPLARGNGSIFVFGQIGQSLDGRVATPSGAKAISGRDGLKHLHRCRALADAVVVGVGTALADCPRLTVRLVDGDDPTRVVIDPLGRRRSADQPSLGSFLAIESTGQSAPDGSAIRLEAENGVIDPHAIVASLTQLGFRRILIEGGGITIGRFLEAGALDRLHVAVAPLLIGGGSAGLTCSALDNPAAAIRPRTSVYCLGTDIIFDCSFDPAPRKQA
jgi:riboflavin-specific deaminase-like protein